MDSAPIRNKRLFIADLAGRLEAMERHEDPMNPVAYRLYARRLREATAGYPDALLRAQLGAAHRAVLQVLEGRYFDEHGAFPGPQGPAARRAAHALLRRLRARPGGG